MTVPPLIANSQSYYISNLLTDFLFYLQQSMIDGGCWDSSGRYRSQSVSDEQWSQLLAAQRQAPPLPSSTSSSHESSSRSRFSSGGGGQRTGRGMTSSTSVCDLNTLAQPHQIHHQQQQQQQACMHQVSLMAVFGNVGRI